MSKFTKQISELTDLPDDEITKQIALLDIPSLLKLQRAVQAGKDEDVKKILKVSDKITKKDVEPIEKKTPNINKYNIGDEIELGKEAAIVKYPSTPQNTMGVLVNGELTMVDKNIRQDRSIRDRLKEAFGVEDDAPVSDNTLDAGDDSVVDSGEPEDDFDLGRLKSLAGLSTDDDTAAPASTVASTPLLPSEPAVPAIPQDEAMQEIISSIDAIEQKILDVRLRDFNPVHQRLNQMIDNIIQTGKMSVADEAASEEPAPVMTTIPAKPQYDIGLPVYGEDDIDGETDYGMDDMDSMSSDDAEKKNSLTEEQFVMPGQSHPAYAGLDEFTRAYVTAMFFADGEELTGLSASDIDHHSMMKIIEDCKSFQKKAGQDVLDEYGIEHAGHDFWFTRNGHGMGFWEYDHGTKESCDMLDKLARSYGECYVYTGNDNKIHVG